MGLQYTDFEVLCFARIERDSFERKLERTSKIRKKEYFSHSLVCEMKVEADIFVTSP